MDDETFAKLQEFMRAEKKRRRMKPSIHKEEAVSSEVLDGKSSTFLGKKECDALVARVSHSIPLLMNENVEVDKTRIGKLERGMYEVLEVMENKRERPQMLVNNGGRKQRIYMNDLLRQQYRGGGGRQVRLLCIDSHQYAKTVARLLFEEDPGNASELTTTTASKRRASTDVAPPAPLKKKRESKKKICPYEPSEPLHAPDLFNDNALQMF